MGIKSMKKLLSISLTAAMCLLLLAACAGKSSNASTSETAMSETSKKTASNTGEKKDLLLWLPPFGTDDSGSLDKEFWTKQLAPWAEKNNVNLTIEITPWGNYEEKYLTGFSSGKGPDVGYMYQEMFNDFIDIGALEPLDNYITDSDRSNYLYLDKGIIKGKQYGMPFIVGNARILYFNKDILDKAGVTELPKTWDDLAQVALKVKNANLPDVMPYAGEWADPAIGALNNLYYPFLWQAGGDIFNKDGSKVALMDNDAAVKAAQFLYDLKFKYGVIPDESMSLTTDEVRTQFVAGHVAIAYMAASASKSLTEKGVNWEFLPSLQDKTKATWIAADALIMNSACKNKDLAFDLIRTITSPDNMTKFHAQMASFPPITKSEPYQDNPQFKDMYSDFSTLHTLPVAKGSFQVMDTLFKNLQLMMLGSLSPQDAIQKTVDYAQSMQ